MVRRRKGEREREEHTHTHKWGLRATIHGCVCDVTSVRGCHGHDL